MRFRRAWGVLFLLPLLLGVLAACDPATPAAPEPGCKVLILEQTVTGGVDSIEAQEAIASGCTVELVNDAGWAAKTQAEFAAYQAIILGDPTCGSPGVADFYLGAPAANTATWSPAVTGNIVIIGTDPVFHSFQGGEALTRRGVDFTVDNPGETGLYITLSCYYHDTAPNTPVPALNGFGTFTVKGVGCFNDAHITATHPALAGLTDDDLSNWSCSVHEAFDGYPSAFQVLAIAENAGTEYTAPDGTVGTPYILARGERVVARCLTARGRQFFRWPDGSCRPDPPPAA